MTVTADPRYRPENVQVKCDPDGIYGARCPWLVVDFDGEPLRYHATRREADETAKWRRAIIKAAITRQRNKAAHR